MLRCGNVGKPDAWPCVFTRHGAAGAFGARKEEFFFEKKNQKTFASLGFGVRITGALALCGAATQEHSAGFNGRWRRRAACIVSARLAALGRPADLIADDALTSLCAEARRSPERLHALLASTLFLASTEDIAVIRADHVRRAALSLPDLEPAPRQPWRRRGVFALAAALICITEPIARVDPPAMPVVVRKAPAPPRPVREAVQPSPSLPVEPPAHVIIHYVLGDPAAALRVQSIAAALHALKLGTDFELAAPGAVQGPIVGFRYEEDRRLAQRVASAVAGGLAPRRLGPASRTTFPLPGTIEIFIP